MVNLACSEPSGSLLKPSGVVALEGDALPLVQLQYPWVKTDMSENEFGLS